MAAVEVAIGTQKTFQLSITDDTGAAVAFEDADVPSARAWPGDASPVLFSPSCSWVSAAGGLVAVSVTGAMTEDLDPALLHLQISVTPDGEGDGLEVWRGRLGLLASPGTATPPATYGTYEDLKLYAPWVQALAEESDQSTFQEQRARARAWLEDLAQIRYRGGYAGLGSWGAWGSWGTYLGGTSTYLQEQLDADRLLVTGKVREVVAKMALSYICESQIGPDPENPYLMLAERFRRAAESLAMTTVLEIDLDNDGIGELRIDLSCIRVTQG